MEARVDTGLGVFVDTWQGKNKKRDPRYHALTVPVFLTRPVAAVGILSLFLVGTFCLFFLFSGHLCLLLSGGHFCQPGRRPCPNLPAYTALRRKGPGVAEAHIVMAYMATAGTLARQRAIYSYGLYSYGTPGVRSMSAFTSPSCIAWRSRAFVLRFRLSIMGNWCGIWMDWALEFGGAFLVGSGSMALRCRLSAGGR